MNFTQQTKKAILYTLAGLQFLAQPTLADDLGALKKNYEKFHDNLLKERAEIKISEQKKLESVTSIIRNDFLVLLKNQDPQLHKLFLDYQSQLKANTNNKLFFEKLNDELKKNEEPITKVFKQLSKKRADYENLIAKALGRKNFKLGPQFGLTAVQENTPSTPSTPNPMTFRAPFSDSETKRQNILIANTQLNASQQSGDLTVILAAVDSGVAYGRAGFLESVTIPANIQRVRVTGKIEYNYKMLAIAILGYAQMSVDTYVHAFDGSTMNCENEDDIDWIVAPLLYFGENAGSGMSQVSCSFRPSANGGEILVGSGIEASTFATIAAGGRNTLKGQLREIRVEFQ